MKALHTPGPWHAAASDRNAMYRDKVADARDGLVADCFTSTLGRGIQEANAHLIAAAPDMLDELRRLFDAYEAGDAYDEDDMTRVRAAIDKAEGR